MASCKDASTVWPLWPSYSHGKAITHSLHVSLSVTEVWLRWDS